jgi:hypothetical protein
MCGKGWDATIMEKIGQSRVAYVLNHDPYIWKDGCDKAGSGGDFDDGCQDRMVIVRFSLRPRMAFVVERREERWNGTRQLSFVLGIVCGSI